MSSKIKDSELDSLIKHKIKTLGLSNDIDDLKFADIKRAVISQLKPVAPSVEQIKEEVPAAQTQPVAPAQPIPPSAPETINQTVSVSKDAVELAKKEGELQQKEKEIAEKEAALQSKEAELKAKEEALTYKPQVPEVLAHVGNAELFVFNEGELSVGAEGLSHALFRVKDNPDTKTTIEQVWKLEGKKAADIYLVKFEKLGELIFNPFEGTSKFEHKPYDDGQMPPSVPFGGLTPEQALKSQEAVTPMLDSQDPVTDVTLSADAPMNPLNFDMEKFIKDRLDSMIQAYFIEKYPKI